MDILVVEDTKTVQDMLVDTLTLLGHRVDTANNGLDALEKAKSGNYDLFVIDHLMPLMNGVKLINNFQKYPDIAEKKIIFITTQAIKSIETLPEFSLFDKVIAKPFNKDIFIGIFSELANTILECDTLEVNV